MDRAGASTNQPIIIPAQKPSPVLTPKNAGLVGPPSENKKGKASSHDIFDPTAKIPVNSGSGYGAGRIKFDKFGNTLQDGKIVQFADQQSKETFLSNQGLGNNGVIVNQAKFAWADFRPLANYNLSGVSGDKNNPAPSPFVGEARVKFEEHNEAYNLLTKGSQPKNNAPERFTSKQLDVLGKSGNAGQSKLAPDMFYRGSAKEDQVKASEADRASKYYKSDANSDYLTGGKNIQDDNIWHPPIGNVYKNMGQSIDNSLVRNSAKEDQVKASEADRASVFYNAKKDENPDYITGGKPDNQGGVTTPQSAGKSFGYAWDNAQLGTKQLVRNSEQEKITVFESGKPGITAKSFGTSFKTDLVGNKDNSGSVFEAVRTSKSTPPPTAAGNGLISLSNQQVKENNIKNEKDFNSFINEGVKNDALFTFYSGNKQVGKTSGARSRYDILKAENQYNNLQISETFPSKEKELTQAVEKNTTFYSDLPNSYWAALNKSGYISKNNIRKINNSLIINSEIQNRENLALLQGSLSSEIHGGPIPTKTGIKNIGPEDNEVASFLKFPFIGQKISTSLVPSTSLYNIAQFYPGIPVVDRLIGPSSEFAGHLVSKGSQKLTDLFANNEIKFKNVIQEKAMENQYNFPKNQQIRPTNLKELEPVGIQISKQTMGKKPETETQTSLRLGGNVKENPAYEPNRNAFNPRPHPNFDINFKTETPTYKKVEKTSNTPSPSEHEVFTRYPLSSLKVSEPFSEPRSTPSSSSGSLLPNKSPLPFSKITESDTQLSPLSREFQGNQFQGNPSKYSEIQPLFSTAYNTEIEPNPTVNLEERPDYQDWRFQKKSSEGPFNFGFRVGPEKEKVELSEQKDYQDFRFSKYQERKANAEPSALDILGQTLPSKAERLQNYPQLPGRSDEILGKFEIKGGGYGGKVPIENYKSSLGHSDININAREFFGLAGEKVLKNSGKYSGNLPLSRYFEASQGKREGDIAFFNKETGGVKREYLTPPENTGRTGPLDIFTKESKFTNAKGRKYYASEEVYLYGNSFIRGSLQTKDIGLMKFEKYQKNYENKMFTQKKINLGTGQGRLVSKEGGFSKIQKTFKKPPPSSSFSQQFTESKGETKNIGNGLLSIVKKEEGNTVLKSNKSSKTETVLLQKPLVKRKIVLTSEQQQYDYEYESKPIPTSKTESGLASITKLGLMSGFSIKSRYSQASDSLFKNFNKNIEKSNIKSRLDERQSFRLFNVQTPKLGSKQFSDILQTPKQGSKPKQTTKLIPEMPSPQRSKQTLSPIFIQAPKINYKTTPIPPKKVLPFTILYGPYVKKPNGKSKSGPTALLNLSVNNIFSSSLSMTVAKNKRVEF